MPLLEIEETPDFMLYSKGHDKYMELIEQYRNKNHAQEDESEREDIDRMVLERSVLLDVFGEGQEKPQPTPLYLFRVLRKQFYPIISLTMLIGYMNVIWMAIIFNLNSLAFDDISYNGIAFGVIGLVSCMGFLPFMGLMRTKSWSVLFQIIMLSAIFMLHLLFKFGDQKAGYFRYLSSFLVLGVVLVIDNVLTIPFYQQIGDTFPVELRGMATSIIQCAGCLISVAAPWLCSISKHWETHFLVSSGLLGFVSLVLTFFLKETLP